MSSSSHPEPLDKKLYSLVKKEADVLFLAPTSIYKSAWIVKMYKKRGGKYSTVSSKKPTGLKKWFQEKWVDLNRSGEACGRPQSKTKDSIYPLCRPTVKVDNKTPMLASEFNTKQIKKANKQKQADNNMRIEFTKL